MRLIDADALKRIAFLCENADIRFSKQFMAVAVSDIDSAPTLSPNEVRGVGKWEMWEDYYGLNVYKCSVCGSDWDMSEGTPQDNDFKYCPNCGAAMSKGE